MERTGQLPIALLGRCLMGQAALFLFLLLGPSLRAAPQFDVFVGYDGIVREAGWFPVVCEVQNDGASFRGIIEISGGKFGTEQTRQIQVEPATSVCLRAFRI